MGFEGTNNDVFKVSNSEPWGQPITVDTNDARASTVIGHLLTMTNLAFKFKLSNPELRVRHANGKY